MLSVKGAPGSKRFWREDCLSTAAQQIPIVNSVIPCVLHLSGMVLFLFLFLFLFMMTLFPLHNIFVGEIPHTIHFMAGLGPSI